MTLCPSRPHAKHCTLAFLELRCALRSALAAASAAEAALALSRLACSALWAAHRFRLLSLSAAASAASGPKGLLRLRLLLLQKPPSDSLSLSLSAIHFVPTAAGFFGPELVLDAVFIV